MKSEYSNACEKRRRFFVGWVGGTSNFNSLPGLSNDDTNRQPTMDNSPFNVWWVGSK
jgi:hypothetical protein